jgi:YVTN family beta-propeller protein
MDLYLLGPIEARHDGRSIALGAHKQRAVLAMLALRVGRTVPTDRLVDGLWGERAPPSAHKMVQLYVSHLRRVLAGTGATIVTRGRGYELRVPDGVVDTARFEALLEAGRAREALGLWRGEPLADLSDEPFAAAEIRRLEELHARAAEEAIDADLAAGLHAQLTGELDALVAAHPLRERLHADRMLALYRSGRQAEALAAYRDARAFLVEQIGVEPGAELRRLHQQILAQDPALNLHPAPATGPPPARPPPRQRVGLVLAAVLLLAGVTVFGISRVTGPEHLAGIDENAVGVIDPDRGAITAQHEVGSGPGAVIGGGGSVWVANVLDGTVSRIHRDRDPVTIPVGGSPVALAFGAGSLWVADGEGRDVAQVDPGANKVERRFAVGNAPRALAFAGGALWVGSGVDGTVRRFDLDRGRVTRSVPVAHNPTALAAGAGGLWLASEEAGTVTRLEPRSGGEVRTIPVGNGPAALAVGEGAVWVANRHDGTVSRIDPATNAVSWAVGVGGDPVAVAAGEDAIWVAAGDAGAVVRVDPRVPRVIESIPLGRSPTGIATVDGAVWAAAAASPGAHRGGTLRAVIPADPPGVAVDWLDPAGYDWSTYHVTSLAYDGLVGYRRAGGVAGAAIVGALATHAPRPSADGRTYVFTLRPGLRYSDGSAVNADDFRAVIERNLRLGDRVPAYYAGILGARRCLARPSRCDLSAGIAVDERARRITVQLARPDGDFLHKLTTPFGFLVPASIPVRRSGGKPPPGTGPYRIAAWSRNRGGVLLRNPHFRAWAPQDRPAGLADRIEVAVRPVRRIDEAVARVQQGAADLLVVANPFESLVASERIPGLTARGPGRLRSFPTTATEWMFLNVERRPFDHLGVRRALNLATDRARVVALEGGGDLVRRTCRILPYAFPGHLPNCPPGPAAADLERARAVVAASGRAGERVVVRVPDFRRELGRYFTALLDRLGFRAALRVLADEDYADRVLDVRSRAQIGFEGWSADYLSPSTFLQPSFTCATEAERSGVNASHSCDRRLAQLVERALGARGAEASRRWAAAERYVVDRAYAVPLTNHRAAVLVSERVGNVHHHLQWFTLLDQLWIE